jgi:hypothetical protein
MNQDAYWKSLVGRVYGRGKPLSSAEDRFYRLSCIFGETMVDGLEAYFDRRFEEFDLDMAALVSSGFRDIQLDYLEAKNLLFGAAPLSKAVVASVVSRLLDEKEEDRILLEKLGTIYDRLITRLPEVATFRDVFGVENALYE